MKIAIHSPRVSYYCGGTERYILNLCIYLRKLGLDVSLITYDASKKSDWFKRFYNDFDGQVYFFKSDKMNSLFNKFSIATEPDIWDKESKLFSSLTKKFYNFLDFTHIIYHYCTDCLNAPSNKQVVLHLHGLPDRKRIIESKAIRIPHKIIAVSSYVALGWKKLYNVEKKINVIYNGIDLKPFPISKKRPIDVLYFGRLIKIKGVDLLIRAIKHLNMEGYNLNCCIVGNGPEKKHLQKLVTSLAILNIKFFSDASDSRLNYFITHSKISVFPSYAREGLMTTLLEASNLGSVSITSNACSNCEFIKHKFNGLIFKTFDYKDLSNCIKLALASKVLRTYIQNKAYKKVKLLSWDLQIKKILKIYKL